MSLFAVFASFLACVAVIVQATPSLREHGAAAFKAGSGPNSPLPSTLSSGKSDKTRSAFAVRPANPSSFDGSDDPYVNYDPAIGAYIECDALEKGKKITKKCPLSEEASMGTGPIRLACQTAFSVERGILHQGCWAHAGDYVEETCTIGTCGSNTRHGDVHFCCCRGSLCNRDYYVRPEIEDAPTADFTDLN